MAKSALLLTTLRWITLGAIGGTIVVVGIDLFRVEGPWLIVALALSTLSFVCCATALHLLNVAIEQASAGVRHASDAAADAATRADEQEARFASMRSELEENRRLQEELTSAKQAAEDATRAKSEFLATMSHEVRTPLNGIVPMLELLQSSKLALDQREMLNTALQSSRQLLRIVDDILDYSKLEAHKLELESVNMNLRETLDSVIRLLDRQAQSKGLGLSLHIDPDVRAVFRGDPVRMRQVVSNLVSNALKFTERGTISVHVNKVKETRTHHQLRIEVRDTGVGIAPDAAGKLFSAFSQADASTTRVYGGTGLGLAICKRIVDLMGGRIGVESELGRGSTFWFEIPMLKAAGDIEGPRAGLQNARVLVLTSDEALRKRIASSLAHTGAQLAFVENTQDALNQLRGAATSLKRGLDVFVVDAASIRHTLVALQRNLAGMNDIQRLRVLFLEASDPLPDDVRELPNTVVAPRALAESDVRPKLDELMAGEAVSTTGRDAPAAVSLIAGADEASEPRPAPAKVPTTSAAGSAPLVGPIKGRLLLVEDNPVNLLVAQRIISLLGPQCDTAENGELALEKIARGGYDMVLMDCQMPVMDGYTATRNWRTQEADRGLPPLPIIAMTANAMAGDRQKCLDAGMDDYLSKPVARDQLEAMLRRWMSRSPRLRRSLQHADSAEPSEWPAPPPEPSPYSAAAGLTPEEIAAASQVAAQATAAFVAQQPPREEVPPTPAPAAAAAPRRTLEPGPVAAAPVPAPAEVATASAAAAITPVVIAPVEPAASRAIGEHPTRPPSPALDSEIIEDLWSAMGDSFRELLQVFLEDAPKHLAKLDEAIANHDVPGLVGPAHALKSSSANLGAMQLSAAAKHIEQGARAGTLAQPQVAVKVASYEFRRAERELRTLLS
ncbi:MAG: response regulator [Proteobacteria bacterium]|nr:response regulator [Pseudomonadota bacterium]